MREMIFVSMRKINIEQERFCQLTKDKNNRTGNKRTGVILILNSESITEMKRSPDKILEWK